MIPMHGADRRQDIEPNLCLVGGPRIANRESGAITCRNEVRPQVSYLGSLTSNSDWTNFLLCFLINIRLSMEEHKRIPTSKISGFLASHRFIHGSKRTTSPKVELKNSERMQNMQASTHDPLSSSNESVDFASDYAESNVTRRGQSATSATRLVAHVKATSFLRSEMGMRQGNRSFFPKATPNLNRPRSVDRYCN